MLALRARYLKLGTAVTPLFRYNEMPSTDMRGFVSIICPTSVTVSASACARIAHNTTP
jgi:hypothetical protein